MGWGVHDYPGPPPEKPMPVCPVCGSECEEFYLDSVNNHEIVGCDVCIERVNAAMWQEDLYA